MAQFYDFNTNTYFYRNRYTGEFSRNNPVLAEKETKSDHVPPKNTDPLWQTSVDLETGAEYWTDVETGKVFYERPEVGTFVSELPLPDLKRTAKPRLSEIARKSIISLAGGRSRRNMDIEEKEEQQDIPEELFFEDIARGGAPNQYDAAAMLGVAGTKSSSSDLIHGSSSSE
jgi:hypothetical protein